MGHSRHFDLATITSGLPRSANIFRGRRPWDRNRADKLFCEAQASISVPSTEKCSSDNSGLTCGWFRSLVMNFVNTSPFCSRSRFLVKVVGSQTGSSGDSPTNQRYKTKHRGIARVAADFLLNLIAYNLIRIPKLLAA
jgi:hypothetical protein